MTRAVLEAIVDKRVTPLNCNYADDFTVFYAHIVALVKRNAIDKVSTSRVSSVSR